MTNLTKFFNPILTENLDYSQYEVIENEVLKSSNLKGLSISGSLFSLTTFKNVTFESCVFFGSRIENCTFIDCKFIDCTFQFSAIEHSNFSATSFENCTWDITSIRKSLFLQCELDAKTAYFIAKDENTLESSINTQEISWSNAEGMAPEQLEATEIIEICKLSSNSQQDVDEKVGHEGPSEEDEITQIFDFLSYAYIAA